MIDCHAHIAAAQFDVDRADVLEKARQSGVIGIVAVTEGLADFDKVLQLHTRNPDFIGSCLGLHPVQVDGAGEQRSVRIEDFAAAEDRIRCHHNDLVAIGEVGLDFQPRITRTPEDKEMQREVLRRQVELAKEFNLPLNVHSRSAGRPTIQLLREAGARNVLLHAFDGKPSVARQGIEAGYFFSIPPSIVRSEQKQRLVEVVPLEQLLLETDSPALGPEKQVRNEPSNLTLSCEQVALIKNVSPDLVMKTTTANALRLFPRLKTLLRL